MANKNDNGPKIHRTVNIDGELYGPGDEDQMLEHLQSKDDEVDGHDHEVELARMEADGHIEGFVDLDDDEDDLHVRRGKNADERATRQAQVEERQARGDTDTSAKSARAGTRSRRAAAAAKKTPGPGEDETGNEGGDEDDK